MSKPPAPNPRDALRAFAPKLIDLTDNVLSGHFTRAINNGVKKEELLELITHLAFYSGWPTAMSAANVAKKVFEEGDKK